MPKSKYTMSSTEAGALIVSGGATDDPEQANLMAEGKLLDPDKLERAYYRRLLGFDLSVTPDPDKHHYIVRDDELDIALTAHMSDDDDQSAANIAKACIKIKKLHDKAMEVKAE